MPPNLVNVMPDNTDEPISARASRARATRPCCELKKKFCYNFKIKGNYNARNRLVCRELNKL